MNQDQARALVQAVLALNEQDGIGLNEHGLGALELGPTTVFLEHKDNALHIVAPAYILRGEPNPKRINEVVTAFDGTGLSFLKEHNAYCYCGTVAKEDKKLLANTLSELAQKAANFDEDLSTRLP